MASSSSSSSSSHNLHHYFLEMHLSFSLLVLYLLLSPTLLTSHVTEAHADSFPSTYDTSIFNRSSFPKGFVFGSASSSYQYEGAANEDGKGPSIWDVFTHTYPEKIADGSNGDVAVDQYHKYKGDVGLMKELGLDAYRLSISWPRLLPKGKLSGGINQKGLDYYKNLINDLLNHGIQPYVTLFHWDLPQALQDEYGGFLSPSIVEDFKDYVDLVFKELGDKVKNWITVNEPYSYSYMGYATGTMAPGRCSAWQQLNCTGGDSATEPYLVSHYQLLAHAAAVNLYKQKYQASQKGKIGITLVAPWFEPYSNGIRDRKATSRAIDFQLGWFLDPITYGEYPLSMRTLVGNRLPKFTKEQSLMLKGSYDFVGLNYYTADYARDSPHSNNTTYPSYLTDSRTISTAYRHGVLIGPQAASSWLHIYPQGLWKLVLYVQKKYENPLIYITENGVDEANDPTLPLAQQLNDTLRIDYHYRHLTYLRRAIEDGVNVKAYFVWTFLDDFEWSNGYTVRFGLNYVDYKNGLKRYVKLSSTWFKSFLQK